MSGSGEDRALESPPDMDNGALETKNKSDHVVQEVHEAIPDRSDKRRRSFPNQIIMKLCRERRVLFCCILLALLFLLLALLLGVLGGGPPLQRLRRRLHSVAREKVWQFSPAAVEEHAERAMERAKKAEALAKQALERERELSKEVQTLASLLTQAGLRTEEPAAAKEESKLKRALTRLFAKQTENNPETNHEKTHEYDHLHDLELLHARIGELEREHDYLRKHAHSLERHLRSIDRDLEGIVEDIREIDAALAADFASVDSDLATVDSQLAASLRRHHEERTKINEIVDRLQTLGSRTDLTEQSIGRIDELRGQLARVDETVSRNAEAIARQQSMQQEQAQELRDLRRLIDRHADSFDALNTLLSSRAAQLEALVQAKHVQQKEHVDRVVQSLQRDLGSLHRNLSADVDSLHKLCRKLDKKADAPNQLLRQYQADLEQLRDELSSMKLDLRTLRPHSVDPKRLALQLRHMEARIAHLEEARERAVLHTQQDHQAQREERARERDAARDSKYNVEEASKQADVLQAEAEAIFKPYQEEAYRRVMDRILGPAVRVMDDLEDKYRGAQQVDASFEQAF